MKVEPGRVFGYWFDFGDDWFHQVQVKRIEQAIPTVTYPRVINMDSGGAKVRTRATTAQVQRVP